MSWSIGLRFLLHFTQEISLKHFEIVFLSKLSNIEEQLNIIAIEDINTIMCLSTAQTRQNTPDRLLLTILRAALNGN
jgi:hypothetical protein